MTASTLRASTSGRPGVESQVNASYAAAARVT